MYPASTINQKIFPYHLGKEFLIPYERDYNTRIELKPASKTNKKIKGKCDGLKLQLNIVFGKMGSMDSWLYDLQALFTVTLSGQFSILMLIEKLELSGFSVIMANTDGIEVLCPIDKEEEFNNICKNWEQLTGYILEGDEYSKMFISTVNDYLAITTSGKLKVKGDVISDFEIYKNKSWRVVPLAIQDYFVNGSNPIDFINNHRNIYDFCIMARANGQLHLEMQKHGTYLVTEEMLKEDGWQVGRFGWIKDYKDIWTEEAEKEASFNFKDAVRIYLSTHPSEIKEVKKLVRYYLSNNSDWQLYKRGIGNTGKMMNNILNASNEIGDIYIQYFNKFEDKKFEDYHVAKDHYILKALKFIDKIEKTNKAKSFVESLKNTTQLALF